MPIFIVTHRPEEEPDTGEFNFVGDLEEAVRRAVDAAGDNVVSVMGGADVIRQALDAGVVEELTLIVAPIVLGGGKRLFEGFSKDVELEHLGVRQSPFATFIDYRVNALVDATSSCRQRSSIAARILAATSGISRAVWRKACAVMTITVTGELAMTWRCGACRRQAHLAEEVAGTELAQQLIAAPHLDRALLDREELVGPLALAHDHPALLEVELVGALGQRLALLAVEPREQRDLLQPSFVHPLLLSPESAPRP